MPAADAAVELTRRQIAEATCFTIIPMVVKQVQDVIASRLLQERG